MLRCKGMTDCTLVTCALVPDLDPDDRLLLREMQQRGLDVSVEVWNAPDTDWSASALCVLRSTWDYHVRYDEFVSWIDRASAVTRLQNDPYLLNGTPISRTFVPCKSAAYRSFRPRGSREESDAAWRGSLRCAVGAISCSSRRRGWPVTASRWCGAVRNRLRQRKRSSTTLLKRTTCWCSRTWRAYSATANER